VVFSSSNSASGRSYADPLGYGHPGEVLKASNQRNYARPWFPATEGIRSNLFSSFERPFEGFRKETPSSLSSQFAVSVAALPDSAHIMNRLELFSQVDHADSARGRPVPFVVYSLVGFQHVQYR